MRRLLVLLAAACLLLPLTPAQAVAPGQLTLQWGRTQMSVQPSCNTSVAPMAGTLTLEEIDDEFEARGVAGVGTVVVDQTAASGTVRICESGTTKATWGDLAALQARGWEFISSGSTYTPLTTLPPEDWWEESCGSLDDFAAHGIDASAEFAYPGNKWLLQAQTDVVSTCFSFGRQYVGTQGLQPSTSNGAITSPWWVKVASLNGGTCRSGAAGCGSARYVYDDPVKLARTMTVPAGRWGTVQAYVLVEGVKTGQWGWDCTGAGDPTTSAQRWTYQPEMYCAGDYFWALDQARDAGVEITTPAAMAAVHGR